MKSIIKWFRDRREKRRIIRVTRARLADPAYRAALPGRVKEHIKKLQTNGK